AVTHAPPAERKRRLTYNEARELDALPDRIDALEHDREQLYASLADPALLRDGAAVTSVKARLAAMETEIAEMMERWEVLGTIAVE
ncbi:MAG TPA: ABC transporter C-terminal domain-containing protein, partial [Gemmatimonadaceae bacterium]